MKILPINNYYNRQDISHKGINNACKLGIMALISSASLFMLSNALDSFERQQASAQNIGIGIIEAIASVLGIVGTYAGLIGLKSDEDKKDKNDKNRH